MPKYFYRINEDGEAEVFEGDGVATRFDKDTDPLVWPIGSGVSAYYEHPEGIVLTVEAAERAGIKHEDEEV